MGFLRGLRIKLGLRTPETFDACRWPGIPGQRDTSTVVQLRATKRKTGCMSDTNRGKKLLTVGAAFSPRFRSELVLQGRPDPWMVAGKPFRLMELLPALEETA